MKTMTRMTLAAAIAATVSTGANAVAVSGTVTAMQWAQNTQDLLDHPNATFNGLAIGGDTVTGLTLTGDMIMYSAATYIAVSWNLTDGMRQGVNGAGGTLFEGGTIAFTTSTDGGATYQPFFTWDASVTNIPFLSGQNGHLAPTPTQTTAGLVVDDLGYGTLPGLWDLNFFGAGWNNAAGIIVIGGNAAGLYMEGAIAPVPIPAAAWLFGSALLGLAGFRRGRQSMKTRR